MKVYVVIYRHLVHGMHSLSIFDSRDKASFVSGNGLDVADISEVPVL